MRLSSEDQLTIRKTVADMLGPLAQVRLFGSRTNDAARGGDIDLLVELPHAEQSPVLIGARVAVGLQMALGDQRIDVLVAAPNLPEQAIHRIARLTGILL